MDDWNCCLCTYQGTVKAHDDMTEIKQSAQDHAPVGLVPLLHKCMHGCRDTCNACRVVCAWECLHTVGAWVQHFNGFIPCWGRNAISGLGEMVIA